MPQTSQLAHRVVRDSGLVPYISNQGPSVTEAAYILGSSDILTNINGIAQRRFGFASGVEPTPTTFNNLQRTFAWDDFAGNFYIMFCDILSSGKAAVYKLQVGVDASAVLIYTEASPTSTAYDFVVSNGTLYFANGIYSKKWQPIFGVTNWGIAIGSQNSSVSAYAGSGANDVTTGGVWTNPGNITGAPDSTYASVSITGAGLNTGGLNATNYGFAIPTSSTVTGVLLNLEGFLNATFVTNDSILSVQLVYNGAVLGTPVTVPMSSGSSSDVLFPFGGASYQWGTTLTPTIVNSSTFGVQIMVTFGGTVQTYTANMDSAQLTVYAIGAPVVLLTTGSLTASTGYQYVETFGNSSSGHVSSPSYPSNTVKPSTQEMLIPIQASTDTQVNQIHVYRTTDSATGLGGQSYFELPTSPVPNTQATVKVTASSLTSNVATFTAANALTTSNYVTISGSTNNSAFNVGPVIVASATSTQFTVAITHADIPNSADAAAVQVYIQDNASDTQLNVYSVAPTPTFNDPPPAWQGMVYFAGRIWGFIDNKVWFTGLEEITVGVPEESVPSGVAGNFWTFDQTVQGLGVAGTGSNMCLLIFCAGRVYSISGNTLDTFQRGLVSNRRGCRRKLLISMIGGMCAWYDSADQIWATDGNQLQELSIPIRPDLANTNIASSSMTFHTQAAAHWLVFSNGEKLFVYDIDQEIWMPPWIFSCQYIYSGENLPGNYILMAAKPTIALKQSTTACNDNGSTYQPVIQTNLFAMVPDFGRRFSYIASGIYDEPTRTGVPWFIQADTNGSQTFSDVQYVADDDPTQASYTTIIANQQDVSSTFNRTNGTFLVQNVYPVTSPMSRWIGLKFILRNADAVDKVYGWIIAYEEKK